MTATQNPPCAGCKSQITDGTQVPFEMPVPGKPSLQDFTLKHTKWHPACLAERNAKVLKEAS